MRDDFTQPWTYWAKWAYTLFVVFLLMLPVLMSIYISFNAHGFSALVYEFTFDWYRVGGGAPSLSPNFMMNGSPITSPSVPDVHGFG